jgi:hypothetical protein
MMKMMLRCPYIGVTPWGNTQGEAPVETVAEKGVVKGM